MLRKPPDILITTPESLYLMLTSRARETLADVECVIVDEIHAVAGSKRGSHLALTLERLEELVTVRPRPTARRGRPLQRIGLSATQRPIEEIARFLGGVEQPDGRAAARDGRGGAGRQAARPPGGRAGRRPARPRDRSRRRDRRRLGRARATPPAAARSGPASTRACWSWSREHSSTIVFVNNRRLAERLALRLNDLAGEEVARSHHGSLSREARTEIEEELKAGRLRCLVATSSLELGIDMGAVDLVCRSSRPSRWRAGLQRIGRAGHTLVGGLARAASSRSSAPTWSSARSSSKRMRERAIEATAIPRSPLDVLAQQIVAMVAIEDWSVDDLHRVVTSAHPVRGALSRRSSRTCSTCSTAATRRRSSPSCGRGSPGTGSRARCARGAGRRSWPSPTPGTIPDRGLYGVHLPDGRRVGELDEEMVYEARAGQTFRLGSTTWRIEEITRDRVIVTPAPEVPGAIPFWKGDGIGRPYELGDGDRRLPARDQRDARRARRWSC